MARENVTENYGSLVDTESGRRVDFDLNPDSFTDEKSTEIAEIKIPGMSHPRLQFTHGGSRTVEFTLQLHYGATDDIIDTLNLLQSWLYAEYESGRLSKPPAKLMLVFGGTWADELWVMKSCNVTHKKFSKELDCIFAQVNIELVEYIEKSRDAKEFRQENEGG